MFAKLDTFNFFSLYIYGGRDIFAPDPKSTKLNPKGTSKMSKNAIKITPEQKKELKALCAACKAAEDAKRLRGRLKTFMEDNEPILRQGIVFDGMKLLVRVSKQLIVTDPED